MRFFCFWGYMSWFTASYRLVFLACPTPTCRSQRCTGEQTLIFSPESFFKEWAGKVTVHFLSATVFQKSEDLSASTKPVVQSLRQSIDWGRPPQELMLGSHYTCSNHFALRAAPLLRNKHLNQGPFFSLFSTCTAIKQISPESPNSN